MASASTILTSAHLDQINKALATLKTAANEIDMAERAGLTVGANGQKLSDLKTQVTDATNRLLAIKNVYFAGQ